ncbi:lytic transglycosylase domain-containing protein [Cohaesibacter haloalkalitolerans]|uniref:lytic transglycosylase domain-containing protein n=1 Tax=Cohaesibacter haloalkalitolerans TaxID=1162980 RepID=UPI000E65BC49|nr:lytic transglycosylase domain-containing protein [Cohaesibacter haloalkalitolerans]
MSVPHLIYSGKYRLGLICSGFLFLVAGFAPLASAHAGDEIDASHAVHIAEVARHFSFSEDWIKAILQQESGGKEDAVSPKGAMGLMQLMPDTWADMKLRHDLGDDPFDPRDNVFAGTAYLSFLWDRYGTIEAMLAAYNAGPTRYEDVLQGGRSLPAETVSYVEDLAPTLRGTIPFSQQQFASDWRDAELFVGQKGRDDQFGKVGSEPHASGLFVFEAFAD